MQVGDIVRIDVGIIPGLEEFDLDDDVHVMNKTGTVIKVRPPAHCKVRVDGWSVDHPGWWFSAEDLELIVRNPDYQET